MSDKDDPVLLREYVESGSEDAFATLVRRYVDLVYSAACRMTNNPHLAQEVTQCVFAALSANARRLTTRRVLSGWLHRTAQNLAAKAVRTEVRRRAREKEAAAMNQLHQSEADPLWDQIAPHLDAALGNLRQGDREVVLLRFFQGHSASEIAHSLGLSEEAAQKRVARALDRLRLAMAERHTAMTAPALASALIAHSVQSAPVGVTALVLAGASNSAGATVGALAASLEFLGLSKLQIALLGLCFVMGSATSIMIGSASERTRSVLALRPDATPFAAESATDRRADPAQHGLIETGRSPGLDRLEAWLRQAATHARGPVIYSDHIDQGEMQFLIWSLPATDYPEAWRLRERLESREIVTRFQYALLEFWAQLDPRAALEAASSLGGRWGRYDPALRVLAAWAEREPAAALSWIQMSLPNDRQATALASVIPSAARSDPRLALAKLEEIPPGHTRQTAFVDTVRAWAGQDPAAAALHVVGLPSSKARLELLGLVASAWGSMNPAAAIAWAEGLSSIAEQSGAISGVIRGLAQAHPTEAAALVNRLSENQPAACTPHIALIVNNWPASDLAAAAQWLTQLPEGGGHQGAMLDLFRRWGEQEPRSAAEFLKTLPVPESHGDSLACVISAWAGRDLAAALDWVGGLSEGALRSSALRGVSAGWADGNPSEAAAFVANLPPGELQSEVAVAVAQQWAQQDVRAAASWVASFPEGKAFEQGVEAIIWSWASWPGQDVSEAARWLHTLPTGPARDGAASLFVRLLSDREPAVVAPWLNAVADETERAALMESMARAWRLTDPEALRGWLESIDVPEEKRRQLLGL